MAKFASTLSSAQFKLARRFADAGITSLSQAVKAFERHNDAQIAKWKARLAEIDAANGRPWATQPAPAKPNDAQ